MGDSMTPPVSPRVVGEDQGDVDMLDDFDSFPLALLQDLDDEPEPQQARTAVCFQCQGEVFMRRGGSLYQHIQFNERSILRSGCLDGLLKPAPCVEPGPTVDLFGFTFPNAALTSHTDKLFSFARQIVTEIQTSSEQDGISKLKKRQYLVSFLDYVDNFIKCCLPETENERRRFLRGLLRQLHLLLVYTGPLSSDASCMRYSLNQLDSVHHGFHHRLDLNWYLLTILHTLTTGPCAPELPLDVKWCVLPSGEEEVRSVFDQLLACLLFDLVSLAVPVFEKLSAHEWLLTSPFPCVCVMELWVLVIHLLRHRKDKFGTESFWVQLHQILQTLENVSADNMEMEDDLDSTVFVLRVTPLPSKPQGFCLWLITHLSHLHSFSPLASPCLPDPTQNCFFTVQMTMEKIMKTAVKEELLRACLRCCLSIATLWNPPNQLLTLLWEYFSKKLNDRFQLHTTSIEGLAVITKSSSSLLERCKKWQEADDTGVDQETSYHLYLRLLARLLTHSTAMAEWRQIKGRFFSKFHQRRMLELQETGLHNMTCLFLTLALAVDTENIARKLLALYEMVNPTSAYGRLRVQVWSGALAMAQVLAKRRLSFDFLAHKLGLSFNSVAKQLSGTLVDYSQRQELSPLIALYMDGVRDIVEISQLESDEHLFIDEGIDKVLRGCGDAEMRHVLSALDSIVMRLRSLVSRKKQTQPCLKENQAPGLVAFADRLWLYVYPFLTDHSTTLTPPLSLADLALSFAHLALEFPAPFGANQRGFSTVVRHFVVSEHTHTSIACHFLNQLLGDTTLKAASVAMKETPSSSSSSSLLSSAYSSSSSTVMTHSAQCSVVPLSQTEVVKCWWRCVLLMPASSSSLLELTQRVMLLPDLSNVMSAYNKQCGHDSIGGTGGWKRLIKALGWHFSTAQSLLAKQQLRGQVLPYFTETAHHASCVMRGSGPVETVVNVYRVLGYLVKHCAPLLYLQSKPCPLPEMIKTLILPASVFNMERPLNSALLTALRDTLHMYLEGLGRLDYQRDSYVQRQVRSIVSQFLSRFPLGTVDVYSHPVLKLLGKLPHQTSVTDVAFHHFVSDIVIENLKKSNSPVSSQVISLLKRRFETS